MNAQERESFVRLMCQPGTHNFMASVQAAPYKPHHDARHSLFNVFASCRARSKSKGARHDVMRQDVMRNFSARDSSNN